MKKKIAILGSTGSIGKTLINILKKDKKNFEIVLLTAHKNYKELIKQAKIFNVRNLIVSNENTYLRLKKNNISNHTKVFNNFDSFDQIFKTKIDYVMSSISGLEGLRPTFNIIKHTKFIAIANKESIICGWNILDKELNSHIHKYIHNDQILTRHNNNNNDNNDNDDNIIIDNNSFDSLNRKINKNSDNISNNQEKIQEDNLLKYQQDSEFQKAQLLDEINILHKQLQENNKIKEEFLEKVDQQTNLVNNIKNHNKYNNPTLNKKYEIQSEILDQMTIDLNEILDKCNNIQNQLDNLQCMINLL